MATSVREIQKPLAERYRAHPEDAVKRYRLRSNPAEPDEVFHSSVTSLEGAGAGSTFRTAADPKVGGPGQAPTPGDLLLAALATCQESSLRMVASALGVELASVEVEVTGEIDVRGALMLSREVPVGFGSLACRTRLALAPGTPPAAVGKLFQAAERCCIVLATLRHAPEIKTSFEVA